MPAVEDDREGVLRDHLIDRPGHAVVGMETLDRGVELEALDAMLVDQPARLPGSHLALVRVDARKGDHHVAVLLRRFSHLLVGYAAAAQFRFRVNSEHDQPKFALPVVRHGLGNGWTAIGAKVPVRGAVVLLAKAVLGTAARDFGVGVDVDRDQLLDVHGELRGGDDGDAGIVVRKVML
jgi:hypothetical protein